MNISKGSKEVLHKISEHVPMIYITTGNTLDMIKRYKDGLEFNKEHENDEISL